MRRPIPSRMVVAVLCVLLVLHSVSFAQVNGPAAAVAAAAISKQVSAQEWLGPLSAVALSPFFGLACLSGAATYGPEWLQNRSVLMGQSSPLNNPLLFWVMLCLTVATSLPRLTKVSKPFALAAEKLEMVSAVIILISMKFLSGTGSSLEPSVSQVDTVVLTAGLATLPWDVFLSIAAVLNIVVVNTIKLAIELLVWLVPFPTVDAFLEVGNKTLSATLLGLYAYSPFLATLVNLCILAACGFVFFRVKRRLNYAKELMMRPMLDRLLGWSVDNTNVTGFLAYAWNGFPSKSSFQLTRTSGNNEVNLRQRGWTKNRTFTGTIETATYRSGLVCDQVNIRIDGQEVTFDVRKGTDRTVGLAAGY